MSERGNVGAANKASLATDPGQATGIHYSHRLGQPTAHRVDVQTFQGRSCGSKEKSQWNLASMGCAQVNDSHVHNI